MDPFSLFLTGASVATQLFGASKSSAGASQYYQDQKNVAALEMQQDQQRRMAMELDANRKSMEVLRNSQRARSMALSNATSSGSQYGSGLQGGYGQISGSTNTNQLGISQNLAIGEKEFDISGQIDQQRMAMADAQSQMYQGQGISAIGKAIGSSMGPLSSMFGSMGGMFGGGGNSGMKGIG
jgi:hypothetical protein